jgi:hypothetical protein
MKRHRKLSITAAHHGNSRQPPMNDHRAAGEWLAHSRESLRAADAEETFKFQVDSIVDWHLGFLFFNLVEGPDGLIGSTVSDDRWKMMFMFHLVLCLQFCGLAEKKQSSPCCIQYVATKKLLRRSRWLLAGEEPDKRANEYLSNLTLNAVRFLEEARLSGLSEELMKAAGASSSRAQ